MARPLNVARPFIVPSPTQRLGKLAVAVGFGYFGVVVQSKASTVPQYLAELPAERRSAIECVRALILENLDPEFEEGMQYGMIGYHVPHRIYPAGYHCDPKQPLPFICLASQKNHMSLYLGCVYGPERDGPFREAWAKTGMKLDMGKSCIRFRRIEDLAMDVIADAVRGTSARSFISSYETIFKKPASRRGKPAAAVKPKPEAKVNRPRGNR
jgi:hypothetical protein